MATEKLSLIYLDDEEINLMLFKEMFKKDFQIHTTSSPPEALAFLKENKVDVVLTDQLMPIMTGVEFLKEVKKIYPNGSPRKVMISGYIQEGEVDDALSAKLIDKFVSKPWTYQGLKEVLLNV